MMSSSQSSILVDRENGVDRVTLNRPDRLNAFDDEMTGRLRDYFEALADDKDCRVVVLHGAGRAFCAGLDLGSQQASNFAEGDIGQAMTIQRNIRNIVLAMRRCPQPIISLIHGAASGGGFVLALASDIRIAADTARMNAAFIKIGLGGCDIGASYLLPRLVGASAAAEMLFTGMTIDAQRALAMGLVSRLVSEDVLEDEAQPIIDAMLATAPLSLGFTKECFNVNLDAPSIEAALALEDRNQVMLGRTDDFREGVLAFKEKREPEYRGR